MTGHGDLQSNGEQRLWFLDNIRYWVAFAVVIFHVALSQMMPHGEWAVDDPRQLPMANWIFAACDVFIMPVFFFIAGYFVLPSLASKGAKSFFQAKMTRLVIPGILTVVCLNPMFTYIYHLSRSFDKNIPRMSFWEYWPHFFEGSLLLGLWRPGDEMSGEYTLLHVWFISYLCLLFVITVVVYVALQWSGRSIAGQAETGSSYRRVLAVFSLISLVACVGGCAISTIVPNGSWFFAWPVFVVQSPQWFFYICYYVLGIHAYKGRWFEQPQQWKGLPVWLTLCGLLTAGYVAGFQWMASQQNVVPSTDIILLLWCLRVIACHSVTMALILLGLRYFNRPRMIDQHLAANSYRIYILHITVVCVIQLALLRMPQLSGTTVLVVGIISSVIGSYLVAVAWGSFQRFLRSLWKQLMTMGTRAGTVAAGSQVNPPLAPQSEFDAAEV